ncbi:alpha/beta hydrolase [Actinomadura sp. ATCC 31491]|uniref:prolyl aminopeptidase n=1 Tax=Actinomadura luzonensis TaxID=2805427 RepID=A0ABT0G5N7_9ACTN|nr:alpha/beta hydrolase [Actinomadura luzonensis]MCK2219403.1 alpha/beta hydrolase [Actinomadura luzonensis]
MASWGRIARRAAAGAAVLALSPVAGLAALAGTAMVGLPPGVFTAAGLAVFASVCFLGLLLCVPRPRRPWARWVRALAVLGTAGLVVWQTAGVTLRPPSPAPPGASGKVPGQREWRLPTGSRLAYVRLAPRKAVRPEPVVFLHGAPGLSDLAADARFYGRLTADGHQVYVYDRAGTGRSARLADPRGYGLARDVADLEAIRREVGADRLNLVARDEGARLAVAYLAAYPGRVAGAVLYAPAALTPGRATAAAALLTGQEPPGPRLLAVYTLLRVDPRAAQSFAGDAELDAYLARARLRAWRPARARRRRPARPGPRRWAPPGRSRSRPACRRPSWWSRGPAASGTARRPGTGRRCRRPASRGCPTRRRT